MKIITPGSMKGLKEASLRRDVLVPLFRQMGFLDVDEYHGGSGEKGKDIVMWRRDEVGGRRNFAVVVKAGPISGSVTGKGSAAEVVMQVRQAHGDPFTDPRTGQKEYVHNILVVASGTIKKEARDAITSALTAEGLSRCVKYLDGEEIERLVKEHLGEAALLPELVSIGKHLDGLSDTMALTATTDGEGVSIAITVKPGATVSDSDALIRARVSLPDSATGKQVHDALTRHLSHGEPVTIPGEYISLDSIPEPLARLLGQGAVASGDVTIGARRTEKGILVNLKIDNPTGPVTLPDIPMRVETMGTHGMLLVSDSTYLSWTLRLMLDKLSMKTEVSMDMPTGELSAVELSGLFDIQAALHAGGSLTIVHAPSGLPLAKGTLPSGTFPAPDPWWHALVRDVATIQRRTEQWIAIPVDSISPEDISAIRDVVRIIEEGVVPISNGRAACIMPVSLARDLLAKQRAGIYQPGFARAQEYSRTIFGTPVPLGDYTVTFTHMILSEESAHCVDSLPESVRESDTIAVEIESAQGFPGTARYHQWTDS